MKLRKGFAMLLALILLLGTTSVFTAGSFTDVAEDAYYADAVEWAAAKEITVGRGGGIFDPDATVNRAEAVTFLWRMAGEPEPTNTETFTDVEADPNSVWYKTAVQWAVELGITVGTGNGNFSPTVPCSRGMILTMLYRLNDCPLDETLQVVLPEDPDEWTMEEAGIALMQILVEVLRGENGFSDVVEGEYYELPIFWAVIGGVLDDNQIDMETHAVNPTAPCTRAEMVYFLYGASGDRPVTIEGAVEVGTIPETVLLDSDGVKVTATGIRSEGIGGAVVDLTVVNGTGKMLRVDAEEAAVNTFIVYPQVCIPTVGEDGATFYADAIVEPGATAQCEMQLLSLDEKCIERIGEMELAIVLTEVVPDGEGYYESVDVLTSSAPVSIRTSLYDANASYEPEGTLLLEKDGLKLLLLRAENDEYAGPSITLYAYNSGSETASLEMAELKLDGVAYDGFFSMEIPAGKRCVSDVFIFFPDYDNLPIAKEAELTLQLLDQETWEPKATFDPLKIAFTE